MDAKRKALFEELQNESDRSVMDRFIDSREHARPWIEKHNAHQVNWMFFDPDGRFLIQHRTMFLLGRARFFIIQFWPDGKGFVTYPADDNNDTGLKALEEAGFFTLPNKE